MSLPLTGLLERARFKGVPLVHIETYDAKALILKIKDAGLFKKPGQKEKDATVVSWDIARGVVSLENPPANPNELDPSSKVIEKHLPPAPAVQPTPEIVAMRDPEQQRLAMEAQRQRARREMSRSPIIALNMIEKFPSQSLIFFYLLSPQEFFKDPVVIQKVWLLRDIFMKNGSMLVFVGPRYTLPESLDNDVIKMRDPLPTHEELKSLVRRRVDGIKKNNTNFPDVSEDDVTKAADSMQGLPLFLADTNLSLSFTPKAIDFEELREQRYQKINDIPGLSICIEDESFDRLMGIDGVKEHVLRFATNTKRRVGAVINVEEVEKMFAGIGQRDNTGIADSSLKGFLKFLDKFKALAIMLLGVPGTGKSAVSKALGNYIQRPTLNLDTDETLNKFVGESQGNLRRVFDTIESVSGGCPLFMFSCNDDKWLPSSFLSRCRIGRFFFPPLGRAEKDLIWHSKMDYYELPKQELPEDTGWVGREIDNCCENASFFNISLIEAATKMVPIARSRGDEIVQMCKSASDKYISAQTGLIYVYAPPSLEQNNDMEESERQIIMQDTKEQLGN